MQQSRYQLPDLTQIAAATLDNGKLIPPQTSAPLALFTEHSDPGGKLTKQIITSVIAKLAVDIPEVVDIDQHQPKRYFLCGVQLHPLQQSNPIGQPSQRIPSGCSEMATPFIYKQHAEQQH